MNRGPEAVFEIVEHDHACPSLDQLFGDDAADEARAAGYQILS